MPTHKRKPCSLPSCNMLTLSARCDKHTSDNRNIRSPAGHDRQKLYKKTGWKLLRKHVLGNSPLCKACEGNGAVVLATVVDHITPHRGDLSLFWDTNNLQSLCKPCHDVKTGSGR